MAAHPLTLSASPTQSQPHALAEAHAWRLLKAACGHSRHFFDNGPAALPEEPHGPICPLRAGDTGAALDGSSLANIAKMRRTDCPAVQCPTTGGHHA